MFMLYAIPVGIALGYLLGGRLTRLADVRIRAAWLFYLALALQIAAFPSGIFPWTVAEGLASVLWLASYGCLALAAVANVRLPGAPVAAAGMLSNLAAVLANGGDMPMTESARLGAGLEAHAIVNNSEAIANPSLPWLVDRFAAPGWLLVANVYSVGDVLILVGAALVVVCAMGPRVRLPVMLRRVSRLSSGS
jgi:hypothetical protein